MAGQPTPPTYPPQEITPYEWVTNHWFPLIRPAIKPFNVWETSCKRNMPRRKPGNLTQPGIKKVGAINWMMNQYLHHRKMGGNHRHFHVFKIDCLRFQANFIL